MIILSLMVSSGPILIFLLLINITIIIIIIVRTAYTYTELITHGIPFILSTTLEVCSMIIVVGIHAVHQVFLALSPEHVDCTSDNWMDQGTVSGQ